MFETRKYLNAAERSQLSRQVKVNNVYDENAMWGHFTLKSVIPILRIDLNIRIL